jgi:succinate dehydrogenase / fumarate reductase cytochrome b subunit
MRISDNLFWRRLHSFTGIAPLGGYLLFHLYTNSYSLNGAASYDEHIRPLRQLPYILAIEVAVIFIPLLYHSVYGLYVWFTSRSNVSQYNYARNWLYTMQRVTGLIAFAFIAYHIYDQRFGAEPSFAHVADSVSNPWVLALYIVGIMATAWHLFNGAWNALIKWGVTIGPKAQKASLYVFSAMGVGLVYMGLRALSGFIQ